jgi:hypothetical protein
MNTIALDVLHKFIIHIYFLKLYLQHYIRVKLPIVVKSGSKPNPSFLNASLAMKADESADYAGSCGSCFRTGLFFS